MNFRSSSNSYRLAQLPFGRLFSVICLCLLSGLISAQGIKLGGEEEDTKKIDLGTAPATPTPKPAAPTAPVKPAANGEIQRVQHGDWEVACVSGTKQCAMAQIGKDNTGTPVLEMSIRKLPEPLEADGRVAIAVLDVITPLGVVLTAGLSVQIDASKAQTAPFQICTEEGCLVREPVAEELITRLKKGNVAKLSIIAAQQGEIKADMSLRGFTKAFAALK